MESEELKRRIASFPKWHYQFDLKGHLTPGPRSRRHILRKKHFFDPLVKLCGGSLAGKRVLDLACNAGFWSLTALEHGADFVLGIDGRQMHMDQARLVFETKEVDKRRYDFVLGDVFETDLRQFGSFDIVLCLGLIYHTSKPMELMERVSEVNTDICLIDTNLSRAPGSYLEIRHEGLARTTNALNRELVMLPTKLAMVDLAKQLGYSVAVLRPQFRGESQVPDYRLGFRRAFLCSKLTNLDSFPVASDRITLGSHVFVEAPMWLAHKLLIRPIRKLFPWQGLGPVPGGEDATPSRTSRGELSGTVPGRKDRG
jgi:SAM-dependent methyltransferase